MAESNLIQDLKSNMDRFIANDPKPTCTTQCYLKSNMDRFIGTLKAKNS